MSLSIRIALPEDAPVLAAAERAIARTPGRLASRPEELHDDAYRADITRFATHATGRYIVALREGVIVGHAVVRPRELAVTAHVVSLSIAVHEGHQGAGVGRALLEELIAWASANPRVEKIELHVRSSNERAIALYRACGFVEEGRMLRRIKLASDVYLDDVCMGLWVGQ